MPQHVPRGLLRLIVLKLLEKQELSGTQIMAALDARSGGIWKPSPGSVYPVLEELRRCAMIESASIDGRTKTYRITKEGRLHLETITGKRRDRLADGAKMGPEFWFFLLEPQDRVSLRVFHMRNGVRSMKEDIRYLGTTEKEVLLGDLREIRADLDSVIELVRR
ncbi:MAG: helix-turn-helix transcriptional regulator [Candidatus Thorarchaeota archaeon]|nr:helix-turn-helix transcriptional regulator [Candidatus Thorarchaeota archaeon]